MLQKKLGSNWVTDCEITGNFLLHTHPFFFGGGEPIRGGGAQFILHTKYVPSTTRSEDTYAAPTPTRYSETWAGRSLTSKKSRLSTFNEKTHRRNVQILTKNGRFKGEMIFGIFAPSIHPERQKMPLSAFFIFIFAIP